VEEKIGKKILIPEHPQLTGAVGAALFAIDDC
jgi:activator of 2-hydroxyglutaryl-CoA dehydratase